MKPSLEQKVWMYEHMLVSRYYEQAIEKIYLEGKSPVFNMAKGTIPGEMHLSNGQEPCAVGVCAHLHDYDIITATHRPHHQAIAKGVDLKRMTAEIFGKKSGLSGGRGGHMHLFDPAVNFSCSGIIGQGMGPAVGAALSRKLQNKPGVAISYIGDAASNQGAFHESLNLAAVWKLPVVFVVEDNAWGISVAKETSMSVTHNAVRAQSYGIPGVFVPGNDPVAIFEAAGEAITRARNGEGPTLLDLETYRLAGHFMGDGEDYRPAGEKAALAEKDPILVFEQTLLNEKVITSDENEQMKKAALSRIEEAVEFARSSDYAPAEEAMDFVFV
ncbi:thiamine pyrophosphate-dependent dehydrogenase E1 component subunit alpha [Paraglaciecola agarilytica]|uniref:thiamine pyrophosphate-dependent dehydrogenase E1 component subunit alpha n=1 Tax=Paraglaciecola chathamensis TaxID=368405 RepID=UPI001C0827E0|nr:thiamine pyrophosphate-dependent dehydrogenase E1 component subunit alpha [Paraglaciecola agarilytica]MBU3019893.1 thiamine pyrophosphate-dependent dehydrogenase E1 component subunit alpha [Paraglaciecola agarilytica]